MYEQPFRIPGLAMFEPLFEVTGQANFVWSAIWSDYINHDSLRRSWGLSGLGAHRKYRKIPYGDDAPIHAAIRGEKLWAQIFKGQIFGKN